MAVGWRRKRSEGTGDALAYPTVCPLCGRPLPGHGWCIACLSWALQELHDTSASTWLREACHAQLWRALVSRGGGLPRVGGRDQVAFGYAKPWEQGGNTTTLAGLMRLRAMEKTGTRSYLLGRALTWLWRWLKGALSDGM